MRSFEEIWNLNDYDYSDLYNKSQPCRPLYKIDGYEKIMNVWLTIDEKDNVSFETLHKGAQPNDRRIVRWQLPAHMTQRMLIEMRATLSEIAIPAIIKNSTIEWDGRNWYRRLNNCKREEEMIEQLISNYTEEADNADGKEFCRLADCEYCNAWGEL